MKLIITRVRDKTKTKDKALLELSKICCEKFLSSKTCTYVVGTSILLSWIFVQIMYR